MEECPDARIDAAATAAGGLPDDALVEILSRVPARSIHRFKCVSKRWRDLIADPLHRKRLPQTLEGFFFFSDDAGAGFRGRFISLPGRSAPRVDPSFSFLTKLPGIKYIRLLGSCSGLLLFRNGWNNPGTAAAPAYVVCNPATEEWVAVPSAGCPCPDHLQARTDLVFDPAVSPHFHLVHIYQEDFMVEIQVRAYSSETRVWSDRASQWRDEGGWKHWVNGGGILTSTLGGAYVNGMLHFNVFVPEKYWIAAMDIEGKTCRMIAWPDKRSFPLGVGQSQGRLHCVGKLNERERDCLKWAGLSIWVLKGYDAQEWVLKHGVSFLEPFGQMSCYYSYNSIVLSIHPDRNLIFIVQKGCQELISYDMDSKEVYAFHTLGHNYGSLSLTPYVPNFMELVLTNDH